MISFPLIARELRVQSRRRATYDGRVFWGLATIGLLFFLSTSFPKQSANGRYALSAIHFCLAGMIAFMAPIGAADAISREKREGTLGLLLLTNLTPSQIVMGKLGAHLIRLFYFTLLMLPVVVIPVLLGGVAFREFAFSFVALAVLAAAGLSAGLIASALCLSFSAALCCSLILMGVVLLITGGLAVNVILVAFPNRFPDDLPVLFRLFVLAPGILMFPIQALDVAGIFMASSWTIPLLELGLILFSLLFLWYAMRFSARQVARHAEFAGESQQQAALRRRFLTPILWKDRLRHSMSRRLNRNPLVWLEYRTAWARSARWVIVFFAVVVTGRMLADFGRDAEFLGALIAAVWMLLLFLTLKSSSSFQREKESGAFELLLVTPMTERKLVLGRLSAVLSYYAPAVLILFGVAAFLISSSRLFQDERQLPGLVDFASISASLISVPVCGLFFALRTRHFLAALMWTAGLAIFAPICLWSAFNGVLWMTAREKEWELAMRLDAYLRMVWWPPVLAMMLYHFVVVAGVWRGTLRLLRSRQFLADR